MQLEDRSECVTDLGFDEWFANEGSLEQRTKLTEHLQACTRCRVRGELLDRERAAFLNKAPTIAANAFLAGRSQRERSAPAGRRTPLWVALSAATLIAAVAVPMWMRAEPRAALGSDGERLKGGSQVGFYVKRGTLVQRGAAGDPVYPGDQLRFTISSTSPTYLALLGRDQHAASVYFPSGAQAVRVESGRDRPLDFSLELDAQLGEEQLYVVLCPSDYALAPLQAELAAKGELRAPAECRIERIALHKEPRP